MLIHTDCLSSLVLNKQLKLLLSSNYFGVCMVFVINSDRFSMIYFKLLFIADLLNCILCFYVVKIVILFVSKFNMPSYFLN